MLVWEGWRRIYFYIMTENMRSILRRWQRHLFTEDVKRRYNIVERQVSSSLLCPSRCDRRSEKR